MALIAANVKDVFGAIKPPESISKFIGTDPTGTGGISKFLSNLVALFYTVGTVVLIFMLLWAAFDWITSEGDKEKIAAARNKIIAALIGILLFGVTFAVITVVGQFTGFKFFEGQGATRVDSPTGAYKFKCPDGTLIGGGSDDIKVACKDHGY